MDFNSNQNFNNYMDGDMNNSNMQNNSYKINKKGKGIKLWVILLIVLIIIIISTAIFAVIYISTDLFKSDKTLFMKYAGLNATEIQTLFEPFAVEQLPTEKYRQNMTVDVDFVQGVGTSEENTDNGINDLKLNITSEVDKTSNYEYDEIELVGERDKSVQLQYIKNEQGEYISGTELFKDEIIPFEEIIELLGFSGFSGFPTDIEIGLSEEQTLELVIKYATIINDNLSDESFSKLENQIIKINGQDLNVNSYTLKITEEQLKVIATKILENVKNDEILLGMYESEKEKEEAIANIDEILTTWNDIEVKSDSENSMSYIIHEKNGKVVASSISSGKNQIKLEWEQKEDKKLNVSINIEENQKYSFSIKKQDNTAIMEFQITETQKIILEYSTVKQDNKILQSFVIEYMNKIKNIKLKIDGEFEELENVVQKELNSDNEGEASSEYMEEFTNKITNVFSSTVNENDMIELGSLFSEEEMIFQDEDEKIKEEIEKFNLEFEMFEGKDLSGEDVSLTLESIKNSISESKIVSNEVLKITLDKENSDKKLYKNIDDIVKKDTNSKYNIEFEYDEETGRINAMLLTIV